MSVQRIGRYEIIGELGEGGMAKVLLAHDPKFKRDVAIKVLPREVLFSTAFRERFQREAETIASLEHSAIVPVYDYGEEDGQPYLVMQQMRGGSLADRIAQGALSLADTAWIVEQIASALDKAHARGVIHRDLKPSNILFDEDGAPFLSDFGIVKVMEATAHLTSGGMIGTPGYMAPEMADAVDIAPQIDVYALGVTLFQMLTGRMPYEASTPMGLMMAHVTKPIPDIRAVRTDIPDEVHHIILRAMAKDPAERYQSAGELATDLMYAANAPSHTAETVELQLEPAQTSATPTVIAIPTPPSTPVQVSRRKSPIGIGAAVVALILIGAVITVVLVINGMREVASGDSTSASTDTKVAEATESTATIDSGGGTSAPIPTTESTPNPLGGYVGNPVTANAQWTPIIQEFEGIPMALVPAGCFEMGSADGDLNEQPVHHVCFEKPFWIDLYEVSNDQYGQTYDSSPEGAHCSLISPRGWNPRVCIDHLQARTFCEARDARLPTEAEWEYAARGPDALIYPWGNEFNQFNAIYEGNDEIGLSVPVGSISDGVSWVGAYDLAGNAAEAVSDWYSETYYSELGSSATNPQGPASGEFQVFRGGSHDDGVNHLRASYRAINVEDSAVGFRCARSWSLEETANAPTPTPLPPPPPVYQGAVVTSNAQWDPVTREFDGVQMALVPPGCFMMGSTDGEPDEQPVHQVCFERPFWIDVYEVTNGQYGGAYDSNSVLGWQVECAFFSPSDEEPHICVSPNTMIRHCETRDARLPTEAEWEYAARGPDGLIYPWGNEFIADNAVFLQNSYNHLSPVGSRPTGVSWVGVFDLIGNASELVSDWYGEAYYAELGQPAINPQGPASGEQRNFRGGGFKFDAYYMRAADRLSPGGPAGWRCARDWEGE